ncbi:MAG TPA: hypothetical protein VGN00_29640 [Puia sp.]|jgi:hypothetical protein
MEPATGASANPLPAGDWTDDQTLTVEIRYNGKVKKIEDYGELGTFGLKRLYSFFFSWKKRVEWEEEGFN